jgi:hypothetical protein
MPKYTYLCPNGHRDQIFADHDRKECVCTTCGEIAKRQMPKLAGQETRELIDKHLGTVWKQDQKEMVQERKADFFWEVEVPRMVNSGIYSLETMLENQWVYYDEKNNLVTRTKPPKRD